MRNILLRFYIRKYMPSLRWHGIGTIGKLIVFDTAGFQWFAVRIHWSRVLREFKRELLRMSKRRG